METNQADAHHMQYTNGHYYSLHPKFNEPKIGYGKKIPRGWMIAGMYYSDVEVERSCTILREVSVSSVPEELQDNCYP